MDVFSGVRIVRSHASIHVVIDVCVVECHAIMDVVIGVRIVLCCPLVNNSTFSDFLLRTQFLLLSCCSNSSNFYLWPFFHVLHRIPAAFEVWYSQNLTISVLPISVIKSFDSPLTWLISSDFSKSFRHIPVWVIFKLFD